MLSKNAGILPVLLRKLDSKCNFFLDMLYSTFL
jgi:hypothetical protein